MSMTVWTGSSAAFSQEPLQQSGLIDPSQILQVHNTLYKVPEGVVGWDTLGNLQVRSEAVAPLQAIFHTDYSPEVKALDGQEVKLMGFIYPLEGGLKHEHFLLTAWPPSCPFCLPAGPRRWSKCSARTRLSSAMARSCWLAHSRLQGRPLGYVLPDEGSRAARATRRHPLDRPAAPAAEGDHQERSRSAGRLQRWRSVGP